jgi:O-antigen ligase
MMHNVSDGRAPLVPHFAKKEHLRMAKRRSAASVKSKAPSGNATPVEAVEEMSIARRISWWALLALIFITPVIIANWSAIGISMPLTYDQFDIIKVFVQRTLGVIALAAWAWDVFMRGGRVRHTPVDWLILAFLAWVGLSAAFSIHPPTAIFGKYRRFEGLFSFINYAIIYFLTLQFADRPSRVRKLAIVLFSSGVLVALYGVAQSLGMDPIQWGQLPFETNRSFSTYGNPDLLGGFLMFSVPVSLALALSEERLFLRGVYWMGFLLNMWCLVTAFTRSAWIGGAVGLVVLAVVAIVQKVDWKTEDWAFSGSVGVVALVVIIKSLSNPNEVMNFGRRLASIFEFGAGSAKTRFEIWNAAWSAVKARPIFGFGADTFRLVFPKYKPMQYVADAGYLSVADNVHNYPLQLASGIGIPGVLMMYGIFAWAAVRSFPMVFMRGKGGSANRVLLGGFWAACAAYIVHLMFGLSVTGTTFLLWTALAVVLAPSTKVTEVRAPSWGAVPAVTISLLAAIVCGYMVVYMQADHAYLVARVAAQGADRTASALRAVKLNPYNDMYRAEVGLAYADETVAALNSAAQAQQAGQDPSVYETAIAEKFKAAESAHRSTIAFVPAEYDNYVFLSSLYNLGGQYLNPKYFNDAIEIGKEGIAVEKYGPAIRVQLARALLATGKTDEAIDQLAYSTKMDPNYVEAALMLAQAYQTTGDKAKALAALKTIDAHQPGNAQVKQVMDQLKSAISTTTP